MALKHVNQYIMQDVFPTKFDLPHKILCQDLALCTYIFFNVFSNINVLLVLFYVLVNFLLVILKIMLIHIYECILMFNNAKGWQFHFLNNRNCLLIVIAHDTVS